MEAIAQMSAQIAAPSWRGKGLKKMKRRMLTGNL
jgi:hypothetical protein